LDKQEQKRVVRNYRWKVNRRGKIEIDAYPSPQFVLGRDGWVDIEEEYSDVKDLDPHDEEERTEEEVERIEEYHDLLRAFREPRLKGTVLFDTEDETVLDEIVIRGRRNEEKGLEDQAGVQYPYHCLFVEGAEELTGEVVFPKQTYSSVYVIRDGSLEKVRPTVHNGKTHVAMKSFSGAGTEEDPWEIYDVDDLQKMGSGDDGWDLDSYYKIMNDIDASDTVNWNNGGIEEWQICI